MQSYDTTGRRLPLPKARYEAPEPWKDADQKQLLQFLKTPSGTKFLLTLHDVAAGRALSVAERTPHDYGITAGMSVMLGLIENMASESDQETDEKTNPTSNTKAPRLKEDQRKHFVFLVSLRLRVEDSY